MTYKLLTTLLAGLFLISFASAIYAGQSTTINLGTTEKVYWDITGNSFDTDGISITQEGSNAIVSFDKLFKPDNFTITFYTIKESSSGGGSSGSSSSSDNEDEILVIPFDDVGENKEVIKTLNQDNFQETNESSVPATPIQEEDLSIWWVLLFCFMSLVILFTTICIVNSKYNKNENLQPVEDDE